MHQNPHYHKDFETFFRNLRAMVEIRRKKHRIYLVLDEVKFFVLGHDLNLNPLLLYSSTSKTIS